VRERLRARSATRIAVATETGDLLLDAGEIDWIEAEDDYAAIHSGARRYRVRVPLAALETRLDAARFARIHRSIIVRLDHVREMTSTKAILLRDGTELPVSRRRASRVRSLLRSPHARDRSPRDH